MAEEEIHLGTVTPSWGFASRARYSAESFKRVTGKHLESIVLEEDELRFRFKDGDGIAILDDGQNCCEHRYLTCDDDLTAFVDAELRDAVIRDAPSVEDEYGEAHEQQFLIVSTSLGEFTVTTHNEHNGYYGGFDIYVKNLDPIKKEQM